MSRQPIRLLVANGCSYTRGAELRRAENAWPSLLADTFGVPCVNMGCDGGSNRRVVRTTVANLERVAAEHRVPLDSVLVVCMWTGLSRHECFTRARDRGHGHRPDLPEELNWHRLSRWRVEAGDAASIAYYEHLWSRRGALLNFSLDWLMLDGFLRSRGVGAYYAFAWDMLPRKLDEQSAALLSNLDAAKVFGGTPVSSRVSFYNEIIGRFPTGEMQHPLEAGHSHFAGLLAGWIRTAPVDELINP